jgi:hypothetical protein
MPAHYAFTDGLVAVTAAWGAWRLARSGLWRGAVGIAMFGVAGAIGTVRFASGLVEPLADVHRFVSQIGGVFGLCLVVSQIATLAGKRHALLSALVGAAAIAGLGIVMPAVGALAFVVALVGGGVLLWLGDGPSQRHLSAAIGFGIMLPNVVLLRQSAALSPDLRWHLYHVIVALWLVVIVRILTGKIAGSAHWRP